MTNQPEELMRGYYCNDFGEDPWEFQEQEKYTRFKLIAFIAVIIVLTVIAAVFKHFNAPQNLAPPLYLALILDFIFLYYDEGGI